MAKKKVVQREFELKKDNSRILKGIIETLSSIIDEAEFTITPEALIVSAMDPSKICLLRVKIRKEDFDEYKCAEECKIGLNLDDLDKILRRSNTKDSIELLFNEGEQKLKIKMKREESERARTFSLALLDLDTKEVPIDNLLEIEYNTILTIEPDLLIEAIKDAEIYAEVLNMKSTEGQGLTFSASGQIGEMNYELGLDELIEPEINEDCSASYSLTFLKAILKIASITERLELSLRTDHPIKMVFNLLEGGELFYFLAPRVDEEENVDDEDMDSF